MAIFVGFKLYFPSILYTSGDRPNVVLGLFIHVYIASV